MVNFPLGAAPSSVSQQRGTIRTDPLKNLPEDLYQYAYNPEDADAARVKPDWSKLEQNRANDHVNAGAKMK